MRRRGIAAAFVWVSIAALVFGAAVWMRVPHVTASLVDLAGDCAARMPDFIRHASENAFSAVITAPTRAAAEETACALTALYGASPSVADEAIAFLRTERGGLVSPETAALLKTREGRATLAKRALKRHYAAPVPPILGLAEDPFFLAEGVLARLPHPRTILETNGVTRVLAHLKYDTAKGDARPLRMTDGVQVLFCGAPIHAAQAERRCRREINALTMLSIVFILVLSWGVFRSFGWLPFVACSLAFSALVGGAALVLAFPMLHVLSFVFGTTVLGMVIDYSYHGLLVSESDYGHVRRNLVLSCLTTEIALVPLLFATLPVLRQTAVFLSVSLVAALAFVLCVYPRGAKKGDTCTDRSLPRIAPRIICLLAAVVAVCGLVHVTVRTDLAALYKPSAELAEAERLAASFGTFDLSALPSLEMRRECMPLVRDLYAEQGANLSRELGCAPFEPPTDPAFSFENPSTLLKRTLDAWTHETLVRLAWSLVALLVVLAFAARRDGAPCRWVVRVVAPSAFALACVAGLIACGGAPLNVFHLLAAFLLVGMGIDYTLFLHGNGAAAMRPALCSLLTSVVGFGALAFVSMPVAASFGTVLGLGLPLAFLAALATAPATRANTAEKVASPFGLELLYWCYRLLGLRILHLFAAIVGVVAWLFSAGVRKTSPDVRKTLLFTRSLADKFAVMTGGTHLPRVEIEESADMRAFLRDVSEGRGVFVLSSHVGTIEVLAALGYCTRTFHAWTDMDRTGVFTRFYVRHAARERVVLHGVSDFGMAAFFAASAALDAGDCVLMAGDRGEGAFRLAAALEHPVYFIACLYAGRNRYRASATALTGDRHAIRCGYETARSALTHAPENARQDFTFAS